MLGVQAGAVWDSSADTRTRRQLHAEHAAERRCTVLCKRGPLGLPGAGESRGLPPSGHPHTQADSLGREPGWSAESGHRRVTRSPASAYSPHSAPLLARGPGQTQASPLCSLGLRGPLGLSCRLEALWQGQLWCLFDLSGCSEGFCGVHLPEGWAWGGGLPAA